MAAALYNMCTQLSGIMASNVYQDCECLLPPGGSDTQI